MRVTKAVSLESVWWLMWRLLRDLSEQSVWASIENGQGQGKAR